MRRLWRAILAGVLHPDQCSICTEWKPNHSANCPRGKR